MLEVLVDLLADNSVAMNIVAVDKLAVAAVEMIEGFVVEKQRWR
jgi:hypothetical protein